MHRSVSSGVGGWRYRASACRNRSARALASHSVSFEPLPDHELQTLGDERADRLRARRPRRRPAGSWQAGADVPGLRLRAQREAAPLVRSQSTRSTTSPTMRSSGRSPPRSTGVPSASSAAGCTRSSTAPRSTGYRRGEAPPEGDAAAKRAPRRGRRLGRGAVHRQRGRRGRGADHRRGGARHLQRETQAGDRAARFRRAHGGARCAPRSRG